MNDLNLSYNLLVIGGGINGAAVARDAALRGMSVLLLEKAPTLAAGASSASSKLAHGGLRYLETMQINVVKESLRERNLLLETCPAHVRPLRFIFPVFRNAKHSAWKVKMGLRLYDWLAAPSPLPEHQSLSYDALNKRYPNFNMEGFKGAFEYYDAQMDDRKLVELNAKSASDLGADILTSVSDLAFLKNDQGILTGATFTHDKRTHSIQADVILNVTGAWSNQVLQKADPIARPIVQASKGVHLIAKTLHLKEAFILSTPQDNRTFFVMPYQGQTLIGTTDTPYHGDLDQVLASEDDIRYLVNATQHYFPSFSASDVTSTFAGLRPLIAKKASSMSAVSRDMEIDINRSGLISMVGGKYTSYRHMAEVCVDTIAKQLRDQQKGLFKPCATKTLRLPE